MTRPRWSEPVAEDERPPTTAEERGQLLVDLLLLTDALPPKARRDLEMPSFREL